MPQLSVAENIFLGSRAARWASGCVDRRRLRREAARRLEELGVRIDPACPVRQLGIAQQQMVEIAKALHGEARAPDHGRADLRADRQRRSTQLFAAIERLTAQRRGRRLHLAPAGGGRSGSARASPCCATARTWRRTASAAVSLAELVRLMAEPRAEGALPEAPAWRAARSCCASRASRGGVLRDVSFSLHRGEVLGMAGLLGAGRTELARVIAGADPPDDGQITIRARPGGSRAPRRRDPQRASASCPRIASARAWCSAVACAQPRAAALPRLARFGWHRRRGGSGARRTEVERAAHQDAQPGAAGRVPFSGGNQQKVVLGKWLAAEARRASSSTSRRAASTSAAKVEIYHLMNRLTAAGAGIIMISSELPEVLGMSDRILVMRQGRIVAELDAARRHQETRAARRARAAPPELPEPGSRASGRQARHAARAAAALRPALDPDAALPDRLEPAQRPRADRINAIVAAGMTFVIISGGIDLSVGSIVALVRRGARRDAAGGRCPCSLAIAVGVAAVLRAACVNGAARHAAAGCRRSSPRSA